MPAPCRSREPARSLGMPRHRREILYRSAWRGWAAGWDSWRHPERVWSENDGEVWGVFSPGSVSLCKRCLFTLAAPERKRCLRDLDRVFLCALMEETKNWEHNTAVMEIQMWWKAMGNQGREMGMKSVPLRLCICTQTLRGALEPH